MFLFCVWFQHCLLWSEVCLNEAIKRYHNAGTKALRQEWLSTTISLMNGVNVYKIVINLVFNFTRIMMIILLLLIVLNELIVIVFFGKYSMVLSVKQLEFLKQLNFSKLKFVQLYSPTPPLPNHYLLLFYLTSKLIIFSWSFITLKVD
jgi:hypothetical protein